MLARVTLVTLASFAVVLLLLAMVGACGGGQLSPVGPPPGAALDGGGRDASRDTSVPPLFGGACPEDAPWTGAVCLGQGYVACPGGYSMDDRSRCVHDVVPGAPPVAPDAADKDDEDPDSSS